MIVLDKFIAIGTQLKVERPGKATAVTVCDSIEGPIVKLNDNSVIRVESEQKARQVVSSIKEILFLGDILISYGDFFNRAHTLAPAGYCEEWWSLELEKASTNMFGTLDYYKISQLTDINEKYLVKLTKNYFFERPDAKTAILLSNQLGIPLHPYYTYHWKTISRKDFLELLTWFLTAEVQFDGDLVDKIILSNNQTGKRILELLGVPHIFVNNEFTIIEKEDAQILYHLLKLDENDFYERYKNLENED